MKLESVMGHFENLRADFTAAKQGRFRRRRTGLALSGSGADYHIRSESDYLRILETARDIDRNDIVVGQGVNRLVDEVLMDGIKLDPQTGDKGLDEELWNRWETWSADEDQCDVTGERDLATIVRTVFRAVVVDGDIVVLPNEDGGLQLVEGHRLRTPRGTTRNVVHGVLLDQARRRLEYWLTKDDIDPSRPVQKVGDIQRYPARDEDGNRQVFHVYLPRRVSQTRGVSAFAPIVDATGMHDDIQFANLVKQQVASCVAWIRTREDTFQGTGASPGYGGKKTETLPDGSSRKIEGISPGMEVSGEAGEKIEGFSPNIPNPGFLEQAMLVLTFIAVNLNLPVQVLLLDPKNTNFSGWRGAMDQARLTFRELQRWLARFLCHVYQWKLRQWVLEDAVLRTMAAQPKVLIAKHRWNCPRWPYIEPLKDAQADAMRLEKRLISPRRLHAEHGHEFEEIADELVLDNAYLIVAAKAKALEINTQFPDDPVTWRDLAMLDPTTPPPPPEPEPAPGEETTTEPKEVDAA